MPRSMNITNLFLVFLGGGIGSVLRFGISWWMPDATGFPWATFWTNLLSCVLIGILLGILPMISESSRLLLITGFCGGLSTFSTFSKETMQLMQRGEWLIAGTYVLASVVVGLIAVFLAWSALQNRA